MKSAVFFSLRAVGFLLRSLFRLHRLLLFGRQPLWRWTAPASKLRLALRAALFALRMCLLGVVDVSLAAAVWALCQDADRLHHERPDLRPVMVRDGAGNLVPFPPQSARSPLQPGDIPSLLSEALKVSEDQHFDWHPGVDPLGIARALVVNVRKGRIVQGGSTLTQQVVRRQWLHSERAGWSGLWRKAREAMLAVRITITEGRTAILAAYLGGFDFGHGLVGLGDAARGFFGKLPRDLEPQEIALLVGMLKNPSARSPRRYPEKARAAGERVLRQMEIAGLIPSGSTAAMAGKLTGDFQHPLPRIPLPGGILRSRVLEEAEEESGGPLVLTLKPELQEVLTQEASRHAIMLGKAWGEAPPGVCVVVLDLDTGAVRACVSLHPGHAAWNMACDARREIGSIAKPFAFVAAIESGAPLNTKVSDDPLRPGEVTPLPWSPRNIDGKSLGTISAGDALIKSRNLACIRFASKASLSSYQAVLARYGLVSVGSTVTPAAWIGAFSSSPLSVAAAFGGLARGLGGPLPVHLLESSTQPNLPDACGAALPVAQQLERVCTEGTGASLKINQRVIAKTGTTDGSRDFWFAGAIPDRGVVAVVWVGRDKPGHLLRGPGNAAAVAGVLWHRAVLAESARHH